MNRYVNLDGSEHSRMRRIIIRARKTLTAKLKKEGAPAPAVKPNIEELLKPSNKNNEATLTWLGHSGWLVQMGGTSLFIDPVMGKRINPFIRKKVLLSSKLLKLLPIDSVLITHDHYDHLQIRFLKAVGAKVLAGVGTGKFIKSKKIEATELKWWEFIKIGNLKITFVPSKHCSQRGMLDANTRLWGGFVIESPRFSLYHAGDTAYFEIFKEIQKSFKAIDVALLPIGCYSPEHVRTRDHMTPEQAVKAFMDLKASLMIPMHWGTYRISDEPLDEPPHRLVTEWQKRKLDSEKLKIMAVGESLRIRKE